MKALSYLSLIIGLAALAAGIYLVFVVVPKAEALDSMMYGDDSYFYGPMQGLMMEQLNFKTDLALGVLLGGGIAVLLAIVPVIKKQKIAWIGLLAGLVATLIGLMHGTHMFS